MKAIFIREQLVSKRASLLFNHPPPPPHIPCKSRDCLALFRKYLKLLACLRKQGQATPTSFLRLESSRGSTPYQVRGKLGTAGIFPLGETKLPLSPEERAGVRVREAKAFRPVLVSSKRGVRAIKTFIAITLGTLIHTSILAQTTIDYDTNNNGLIDITTLAQLDAIRHDLNGNGDATHADYVAAFPNRDTNAATRMGCPSGTCTGYELMDDLDFDTNGDGDVDVNDGEIAWGRGTDAGNGWLPIGTFSNQFTATFQGNGHVIRNLFINRSINNVGLFGYSTGRLSQLGLVNVEITGEINTGGLVGRNLGTVSTSYVSGQVAGDASVGGLVGQSEFGSSITASYTRDQVRGNNRVGGLKGWHLLSTTTASYATGQVTGNSNVGGLIGTRGGGAITASYWDTETTGQSSSAGSPDTAGKTTAELQTPTDYTGIYADWNIDVDGDTNTGDTMGRDNPWAFGTSSQYPVLRYGRTQAQIRFQFDLQTLATADVNRDGTLSAQDALIMYRTYLPGVRGAGVAADDRERATAWQESGRTVGGDLNGDGDINEYDALIMFYAYQFRVLLQNHAALRQLLFNGLRGEPRQGQPIPDTDATYREFLMTYPP